MTRSEMNRKRKRNGPDSDSESESASSSEQESEPDSDSASSVVPDSELEPHEKNIRRYLRERRRKRGTFCPDFWERLEEQEIFKLASLHVEAGFLRLEPSVFDKNLELFFEHARDDVSVNSSKKITRLFLCFPPTIENSGFLAERIFDILEKFEALESIELMGCRRFRLCEIIGRLPNLKFLKVRVASNIDIRPPEDPTLHLKSPSKLEKLVLSTSCIEDEEELASFVFETMPFIPRLSELKFGFNRVRSFQGLARRLRNNGIPENRLRVLDLGTYGGEDHWLVRLSMGKRLHTLRPVSRGKNWKDDVLKERAAVQAVLESFWELQTLIRENARIGFTASKQIAAQTYQMEINHAGRVLVERNRCKKSERGNMENNAIQPDSLPASIWPRVLARACEWKKHYRGHTASWTRMQDPRKRREIMKKDKPTCDGIYYLLQNVEVLRAMSQRKPVARKVFYKDEWHYTFDLPPNKK